MLNLTAAVTENKKTNIFGHYLEYLLVYISFAIVVFAAHFIKCANFGLYEDDYAHIAPLFFNDFDFYLSYIKSAIFNTRGIGYLVCGSFSYVAGNIFGNLTILYIFGVFIIALNTFFIYIIAKNYLSILFSFLCGLFFILIPIDTTKEFLTHIYFLQISLLFSFVGIIMYRHGKIYKLLSFFVASLSLLTYESGYIIFLFACLLTEHKQLTLRNIIKHLIFCGLSIGVFFIYKLSIVQDEYVNRVIGMANESVFNIFKRFLEGMVIGSAVSGASLLRSFFLGFSALSILSIKNILLIFMITISIVLLYKKNILPHYVYNVFHRMRLSPCLLNKNISIDIINIHKNISPGFYFLIISAIMIPCSYLMSITHYPPTAVMGRGTSVHLVSTVSWAFFIPAALSLLCEHWGIKRIILICIIFLSSWLKYATMIQNSFINVKNEEFMAIFSIRNLCPDVHDADIIIIHPVFENAYNKVMTVYHWALPVAFEHYFGEGDYQKPRFPIHRPLGGVVNFRNSGEEIEFYNDGYPSWGKWLPVTEKTIFLTDTVNGGLIRLTQLNYTALNDDGKLVSFDIGFKSLSLDTTNQKNLPTGPLYRLFYKNNLNHEL